MIYKAVNPSDLSRCAEFRRLVLQPSGTLRQLTSALFPTAPARLLQSFRLRFACTPASQQTRSTYRTDGPRTATFFQNVAFFPSHFNEKRSSPLISAGVLSSEGLCSSHLALLRQVTSALFPTAPARLCDILNWKKEIEREHLQNAHERAIYN